MPRGGAPWARGQGTVGISGTPEPPFTLVCTAAKCGVFYVPQNGQGVADSGLY
jgi:hypothetical protein